MKFDEIIKEIGAGLAPRWVTELAFEPAGYSIDSRTVREGELFFAIRGENYDGHRFVAEAIKKGAFAAVVSDEFAAANTTMAANLVGVADTLAALQQLASAVLRNWPGRAVGITGSMGKTTTKEMTAAALARGGSVTKTTGNLNNAYGLPLSVLKMETDGARASDFDFAVFEMGMNHKGEISELTRIAPPDLGLVTIVAPVHLEFFPSVDAIAEAKAEMVGGIKPGGVAVLNADDERVARMRELRTDIDYRLFGMSNAADVTARNIRAEGLNGTSFLLVTPRGEVEARLRLAGRHNVYNALAAAAVADFYEVPLDRIAEALFESSSPRMRGEVVRFKEGFTLIDDSYNSNPRALVEMMTTICANEDCQRRVVVAGEMLELGATGTALHREAGESAAELGVDLIVGVRGLGREIVEGARARGMSERAAVFCETPEEAAELLAREARAGDLILVKGSRGVKTEIVVQRMKQKFEQSEEAKRENGDAATNSVH
ncbi:MAG TPA: UDP-N-acetylmuramoyl-tripeptide--D-alanyl-D-alanine ligase [Blastocatellia bacterium]|nr:UDP-N-acetylmuramoyl-tripeptide--D-alanyl-D-alanine ligase [Blastocatellia bacterium]